MQQRILVIEDDAPLAAQIVEHLQAAHFSVDAWERGQPADAATWTRYQLVILDIMLPGIYGLDLLKQLRAVASTPVLILSARNDTLDKVRALRLGADDYMTKPFWPDELVERVRARLRRPALQTDGSLTAGGLSVDPVGRKAELLGRSLELTRVEFDLLTALMKRPGAAVPRQTLVDQVLDPERDGNERTLDVHMSRLRKKLGDTDLIETVWGIGYRLRRDA